MKSFILKKLKSFFIWVASGGRYFGIYIIIIYIPWLIILCTLNTTLRTSYHTNQVSVLRFDHIDGATLHLSCGIQWSIACNHYWFTILKITPNNQHTMVYIAPRRDYTSENLLYLFASRGVWTRRQRATHWATLACKKSYVLLKMKELVFWLILLKGFWKENLKAGKYNRQNSTVYFQFGILKYM